MRLKNGGLEYVLRLAGEHLHCCSIGGETNGSDKGIRIMSLKQLVPAHQSLLEVAAFASEQDVGEDVAMSDTDVIDSKERLRWLEKLLISFHHGIGGDKMIDDEVANEEKDLRVCREILGIGDGYTSTATDSQKLLVWQYLLQRARVGAPSSTSMLSMDWLYSIVFHYLLPMREKSKMITEEAFTIISDELMEILLELSLEWIFYEQSSRESNDLDMWTKVREHLLTKTRNTTAVIEHNEKQRQEILHTNLAVTMPLSSKIAAKIVLQFLAHRDQHSRESLSNNLPFFLSLYYEHLWCNLEFCCNNFSVTLLSEVSQNLLLPLLNEFETRSFMTTPEIKSHLVELDSTFRARLFPLFQKEGVFDSADDYRYENIRMQNLLLIATTALCPLLPWFWKQHQQQFGEQELNEQVWKLIYSCLHQGRRSVVYRQDCESGSGRSNGDGAFGTGGLPSMLRRRALYLLDVITPSPSVSNDGNDWSVWKDYILCAETFEMEGERHIVDQIWPVIAKLIKEAWKNKNCNLNTIETDSGLPLITPSWIELLLGRVLSTDQLAVRKLGLFRILQALGRPVTAASLQRHAVEEEGTKNDISAVTSTKSTNGISVHDDDSNLVNNKKREIKSAKQHQQPKKKKTSSENTSLDVLSTELLLRFLSPQTFLWDVLVPSWDSLGRSSVGYTIHLVENKHRKGNNGSGSPMEKFAKIDMVPLFCQTIRNYAILADVGSSDITSVSSSAFWKGLWDWNRVGCHLSAKTYISIFGSVSELLETEQKAIFTSNSSVTSSTINAVPMDDNDLKAIRHTYVQLLLVTVLSHRRQLLQMLSLMLSKAKLPLTLTDNGQGGKRNNWTPISVLSLLGLFSPSYFPSLDSEDVVDWSIEKEDILIKIRAFVERFESQATTQDQAQRRVPHSITVGATLASAFVSGQVCLPNTLTDSPASSSWNPVEGSSKADVELGWAISLFCSLAVSGKIRHTAGELLWPAVHKGLSQSAVVILSKDQYPKAEVVARALVLLENGCRLRQLSGLGNGDLVVNPKTQQIMPPPPNIEQILQNCVDFVQWHIRQLLATETHRRKSDNYLKGKRFTSSFVCLISQLKILHQSYPSSQAIGDLMNGVLNKSTEDLLQLLEGDNATSGEGDVKKVLLVGLIYSACSCGAEPQEKSFHTFCRILMRVGLSTSGEGQPGVWVKSSRSIIQFGRWAAISCILPRILDMASENASDEIQEEINQLVDDLLKEGMAASSITPSDAIKPLFDCIVMTSRQWICASSKYDSQQVEALYIENLTNVIKTLLLLIKLSARSRESAYMLNEFCALIFQPELLLEEYERLQKHQSKCRTPIRDAFRQLIKMAGRQRPQITRAVLCRITVGWLGDVKSDCIGISAIPYRDDIVQLLLHKEVKKDESSTNQSKEEIPTSGVTEIPPNTHELSITRAFLLVFFSRIPDPEAGLNSIVKTELLHYIILQLLKHATPEKGTHPSLVMKGTPTYCIKMRGWQSLCILSRFVTQEIALSVCKTVFQAMNELLHSQIRYFLENFTIKCATMHCEIFGEAFLQDISRTDLSLQHISSLMIMGGNFIVGKYKLDYFVQNDLGKSRSKRVLASVIPWLSSTQGFSRAIAQLMVYQLIPKVVSLESLTCDNDWFLKSTYNFLDQNREMKRLRNKQTKFFEHYDCEVLGTPEGVFSIRVDETHEADPVHMIDAMKETLRNTYDDAHGSDVPAWKRLEELLVDDDGGGDNEHSDDNIGSTVQRKIIPLDSLNLALENLKEQRLSNTKGTHKQELIVCASLVDKVPNLAGLARTCEIFAAQSLVIPDMSVAKMDHFQSISVGAVDWIDMDEVKEEALLSWLLQKKSEGFWIVGLEQTSSSSPLHQVEIPNFAAANNKTVLLLGKEKEGIPVQYLQAVDKCVEIPQFGMIRSLNVHVSGAITIWELTRRTRLMELEKLEKQQ
eukprot:CAMPEP_0172359626 /NCGR_PEP_ID=MMETSP1060-20121228/3809_1 /TAXON_ID=37318 /ORGANISM="Pseudo-nitzschia pungens, Strain cf. cingulata" /LENGTH=1935 /DNA_ID=CAMNT_0013081375 /DNA_START=65 /DNA_END=5872 /DNA_ORIENTATION=+